MNSFKLNIVVAIGVNEIVIKKSLIGSVGSLEDRNEAWSSGKDTVAGYYTHVLILYQSGGVVLAVPLSRTRNPVKTNPF